METRSKSFQNCTEAEIPGYNDCPSFLFQVNKAAGKSGRRNRITTEVRDVSGTTKIGNISPPPLSSRKSKQRNDLNVDADCTPVLPKEEIWNKINELFELESRLSSQEFAFYKKKIDGNLEKSLDSESSKHVLSMVFNISNDKEKSVSLLKEWLSSDTSVSSWCPAFLKIYENSIDETI